MGAFYETIPENIIEWIRKQKMIFVATAPLSGKGHVNVSPKGGEYFGVVDEKTFWYHDLTGSGNETICHLYENGRITIMLNAFEGGPKIVRLWGKGVYKQDWTQASARFWTQYAKDHVGNVLENGSPAFDAFVTKHNIKTQFSTRCIIVVDVHQVGSSCGFSVPFYDFKEFRPVLFNHFEKKREKFEAGKEEESMDQ